MRSGAAARVSFIDSLAETAKDTVDKSRAAHSAAKSLELTTAGAELELNRFITTGSAITLSVDKALKEVEAIMGTLESARLLALNATLEASRFGGQGARVADEMRRLAEVAAGHAQALATILADARSSMRVAGRAAQEAGRSVHQATTQSAESARELEETSQGVNEMLSQMEAVSDSAINLREQVGVSDRGRSAVDGVARIMDRIEALCSEIASLASTLSTESAQAQQRASDSTSTQGKRIS
jgi:methyl-accepting chemotaxis protein